MGTRESARASQRGGVLARRERQASAEVQRLAGRIQREQAVDPAAAHPLHQSLQRLIDLRRARRPAV